MIWYDLNQERKRSFGVTQLKYFTGKSNYEVCILAELLNKPLWNTGQHSVAQL